MNNSQLQGVLTALRMAYGALPDGRRAEIAAVADAMVDLREMLSRQETHSEECWKWHHECAVAKIERLAQMEQNKFSCGVDFDDGLLTVSVVRGQADGLMEVIHCEQIELGEKK